MGAGAAARRRVKGRPETRSISSGSRERTTTLEVTRHRPVRVHHSPRDPQRRSGQLVEMAATSKRYGARLLVINLEPVRPATGRLVKILRMNQIEYGDCAFPLEGMLVPGERHPNGEMNSLWSDCIADALGDARSQRMR